MWHRRETFKALKRAAKTRAREKGMKIKPDVRWIRHGVIYLVFFVIAVGSGFAVPNFTEERGLFFAGTGSLLLLVLQWSGMQAAATFPGFKPPYPFYPIATERIWRRSVKNYRWMGGFHALWAVGMLFMWLNQQHSTLDAILWLLALAACYGMWMMCLPLLVVWFFPRTAMPKLVLPGAGFLFFVGVIATNWSAIIRGHLGGLTWVLPGSLFYRLILQALPDWQYLVIGLGLSASGAWVLWFLSRKLGERIVSEERLAEERDVELSEVPVDEENLSPFLPKTVSLPEGRSLLEQEDWMDYPSPKSWEEKIFWKTLNHRQKRVAKLLWPLGLNWRALQWKAAKTMILMLALAALLRLLGLQPLAHWPLLVGAVSLFIVAPPFPGGGFIFQQLYLGGKNCGRWHFLPVTLPEIIRLMGRCQWLCCLAGLLPAAIFGVIGGLLLNWPWQVSMAGGMSVVPASLAVFPMVVFFKLATIMRCGGRPVAWLSLAVLTFIGTLMLIAVLAACGVLIFQLSEHPGAPWKALLFGIGGAMIFRMIGEGFVWLVRQLIEHNHLDATTKIPKSR